MGIGTPNPHIVQALDLDRKLKTFDGFSSSSRRSQFWERWKDTGCEHLVLVHLGCYDKIPQPGWLINNKNLFLTVLESESLILGCQQGLVSSEASVLGL